VTKRTEIEIDELTVVSRRRTDTLAPLPVCAGRATVTPEEAAAWRE